jgi:hypothetical protein
MGSGGAVSGGIPGNRVSRSIGGTVTIVSAGGVNVRDGVGNAGTGMLLSTGVSASIGPGRNEVCVGGLDSGSSTGGTGTGNVGTGMGSGSAVSEGTGVRVSGSVSGDASTPGDCAGALAAMSTAFLAQQLPWGPRGWRGVARSLQVEQQG